MELAIPAAQQAVANLLTLGSGHWRIVQPVKLAIGKYVGAAKEGKNGLRGWMGDRKNETRYCEGASCNRWAGNM